MKKTMLALAVMLCVATALCCSRAKRSRSPIVYETQRPSRPSVMPRAESMPKAPESDAERADRALNDLEAAGEALLARLRDEAGRP